MDDIPNIWREPPPEPPHDHKGHSEEKCVRCGWVMGHQPLNCMNDDTPHRFPSQEAEIERLRAKVADLNQRLHGWTDEALMLGSLLGAMCDMMRRGDANWEASHD